MSQTHVKQRLTKSVHSLTTVFQGVPTIAHGYPIKAVCINEKAMKNGNTEQVLYCKENTEFTFPDCSGESVL